MTRAPVLIVCPVTARTWPPVAAFALRDCAACGGIIDTRHEAWQEGHPAGARHLICPQPARAPRDGLPEPARPRIKATAADPRPVDDVHATRLDQLREVAADA